MLCLLFCCLIVQEPQANLLCILGARQCSSRHMEQLFQLLTTRTTYFLRGEFNMNSLSANSFLHTLIQDVPGVCNVTSLKSVSCGSSWSKSHIPSRKQCINCMHKDILLTDRDTQAEARKYFSALLRRALALPTFDVLPTGPENTVLPIQHIPTHIHRPFQPYSILKMDAYGFSTKC